MRQEGLAKATSVFRRLVIAVFISLSTVVGVLAADTPFHANTNNFSVDIGVVAARDLRKRPDFIDRHKEFHGEALYAPDMHHLTVALSDRKTGKNVLDATVIAAVRHKKWRHAEGVERPLERMAINDTISYGNFFRMAEPGTYEISLKIYRPQANGPEEASFSYEKPKE